MRIILNIILILLCVLKTIVSAGSIYYYENFDVAPTGWDLDFRYGRDGILFPGSTSSLSFINNDFRLTGIVNDNTAGYNTFWCGRCAKYNTTFSASTTNPFGFKILRKYSWIDARRPAGENNLWQFAGADIWLIEETGINNEWEVYNNYVCFYETSQCTNYEGKFKSKFGVFIGSKRNFDLGKAKRPDGRTINLTNSSSGYFSWEWLHTDNYGGVANTNWLGIMITHNGSLMKFYLNPNPNNSPGNNYPNEYCLIGSNAVTFNNNLKIMLGHECNMAYTERENVTYDDLLIRSVAKVIKAEITPIKARTDEYVEFAYLINPEFSPKDSGIGEIKIYKPSKYKNMPWSSIRVRTEWGDGMNDGNLAHLKTIFSGAPKNQQVLVITNGNVLGLRFCQESDTTHNVINHRTLNRQIEVKFTIKTPIAPYPIGDDFQCFANCIKYDNTGYSFNSTTDDKKAIAGNVISICYSMLERIRGFSLVTAAMSLKVLLQPLKKDKLFEK